MSCSKKNIFDYDAQQLKKLLDAEGFQGFRASQIINWIHQKDCIDFNLMSNISLSMRSWLNENFTTELLKVVLRQDSHDGTLKWLFQTDKGRIETVYIPHKNRGTLCVSSQVGCALACAFCATGSQGLVRNLNCSEIIAQLYIANKELTEMGQKKISNIVFMGMGEPLMNEKHVYTAINLMLDDNAYGLAKSRVTVSTSGIVPAMYRVIETTGASLAVSLHACNDQLRDYLVPINKKYPLRQLMTACKHYVKGTDRSITFEYTMIDGVNDAVFHAQELVKLLSNLKCKINLIPCNPISGRDFKPSNDHNLNRFESLLRKKGFRVTVRKTRGDDINAACGQLANTALKTNKTISKIPVVSSTDTGI